MSEEKKVSKDSKKMKYEAPKLVKLNVDEGEGDCASGSTEGLTCGSGGTATDTCSPTGGAEAPT